MPVLVLPIIEARTGPKILTVSVSYPINEKQACGSVRKPAFQFVPYRLFLPEVYHERNAAEIPVLAYLVLEETAVIVPQILWQVHEECK